MCSELLLGVLGLVAVPFLLNARVDLFNCLVGDTLTIPKGDPRMGLRRGWCLLLSTRPQDTIVGFSAVIFALTKRGAQREVSSPT